MNGPMKIITRPASTVCQPSHRQHALGNKHRSVADVPRADGFVGLGAPPTWLGEQPLDRRKRAMTCADSRAAHGLPLWTSGPAVT